MVVGILILGEQVDTTMLIGSAHNFFWTLHLAKRNYSASTKIVDQGSQSEFPTTTNANKRALSRPLAQSRYGCNHVCLRAVLPFLFSIIEETS